jgi:type I restriction enzyme S subunit
MAEWTETTLGKEFKIIMGQSPSSKYYNDKGDGMPFFQGKKEFNDIYPHIKKWTTQATKKADQGDVLLSVRAPIGAVNIAPANCGIGRGLAAIKPNESTSNKFIFYLIQFEENALKKRGSGVTFSAITKPNLYSFPIRIPKNKETRNNIVDAVETQFTRLESSVKSLQIIKYKLGVYRQSVLKAAFEGNLVATDFESITVKDVAASVTYGTSQKAKQTGNIPVLRMGNLNGGKINYSKLKFYDSLKEIEDLQLEEGDILFNRTNSAELVGKTSIFKKTSDYKNIVFASYLIRVRVDKSKIVPAYLNYWLNSPRAAVIKSRLKSQQVGQANINGTKLKNMKFPYTPDLNIQKEIIDEIESRLSVADKVAEVVDNALHKAERLRKSILKSAFEGKLIKQVC